MTGGDGDGEVIKNVSARPISTDWKKSGFIRTGFFSRLASKSNANKRKIDDAILYVAMWRVSYYKSK